MNEEVQRRPRREVRVQTKIAITLLLKPEGEERVQVAASVDVSAHGLRIETAAGIVPGQRVYAFARDPRIQFGPCRVVWTQAVAKGKGIQAGLEVLR